MANDSNLLIQHIVIGLNIHPICIKKNSMNITPKRLLSPTVSMVSGGSSVFL
jgi:hypothetical protein